MTHHTGCTILCTAALLFAEPAQGQHGWVSQGPMPELNRMCFLDSLRGFAVGERNDDRLNGIIAQTTDGGKTWDSFAPGGIDQINDVSFFGPQIGVAVGQRNKNNGPVGTIIRTTDGGTSWLPVQHAEGGPLLSVHLSSSTHGTAVGDGMILKTTDGGVSWTNQSKGTTSTIRGMSFTDQNTGTAVGERGTILRTTDGGVTWENQASVTPEALADVKFFNAEIGMAVGSLTDYMPETGENVILRTTNGGSSWSSQHSGFGNDLTAVAFTGPDSVTVVGNDILLRTTDGGVTWKDQTNGTVNTLNAFWTFDQVEWHRCRRRWHDHLHPRWRNDLDQIEERDSRIARKCLVSWIVTQDWSLVRTTTVSPPACAASSCERQMVGRAGPPSKEGSRMSCAVCPL